jgi:hypothetical protein
MEVERGVDAATLDIGFDTNGLLDTQAIIDFATAGGGSGEIRIRTWYDQTGNSRHAQTSVAADMSYIYSGSAIYQANGKPVVDPRGTNDGLYPILGTYSTAANNTIFTVISPGQTGGSYVMTRPIGSGGSGILAAGIEEPIGGWNANIDYGFGTTQYYRDGAFYGNSTLQRNDIMQSVLASRRIFDIGFTQSGLNSLNFGRNGSSSIYATQEYIVYFSDQLGTVPRTALEGNINSYYQVANLPDYTSGFLADYPDAAPDAAAAYSVRKLSNTAIKALRVRRTVAPFDELDIGFTAGGDLDEAAISTFGASDTLVVSRWYDQSGFSRHAVQIIPGSQPQIYNGTAVLTENGKPFLKFRGGNSGNESMTMESEVACETTFSVVANDTPGFLAYYLWSSGALGFFSGGTISGYTGPGVAIGATAGYIVGTETGQTLLYNDHNGTGWEVGQDGGAATQVVATGAKGINQIVRPSTNLQVEKFQEVIIYDSDKSTYRTAIETNINDYYTVSPNGDAPTSGFLFDYSGATFAYSIRQLNDNADYCMQVIRADGVTFSIGFDGSGYVDTAAIVSFAAGQKVYLNRMYDQTGNRYHSGTVSSLIGTTTLVVVYDGTNLITKNGQLMPQMDLLSQASNSSMVSPTGTALGVTHSLYAVAQRPSAPNALNMFSSNAGVTALYQERSGNLTYGPGWTSFGIYTYPTVSNEPRLYSYIRKNGTDGECFNDGVSQGTTTAMTAATSVNISGYRFDKTQTGIQADCSGFQEMIAYTADRTAVGDNANILANIKAYYPSIP